MFNLQGSEIVFLLLIALVVLGPEKLPDAVRKFAKGYAEFRKMATGFQGELKSVLDEPLRELRQTADAVIAATQLDPDAPAGPAAQTPATGTPAPGGNVPMATAGTPAPAANGLDFGNVAERRRQRAAEAQGAGDEPATPVVDASEPWE